MHLCSYVRMFCTLLPMETYSTYSDGPTYSHRLTASCVMYVSIVQMRDDSRPEVVRARPITWFIHRTTSGADGIVIRGP